MTTVTGGTEIIKRHHLMTPIEHGCLGDLQDLVAMARNQSGSDFDDAARLVPDDENVHLVWEEVVDKDYESELDKWTRFASITLDMEIVKAVVANIKAFRDKESQ